MREACPARGPISNPGTADHSEESDPPLGDAASGGTERRTGRARRMGPLPCGKHVSLWPPGGPLLHLGSQRGGHRTQTGTQSRGRHPDGFPHWRPTEQPAWLPSGHSPTTSLGSAVPTTFPVLRGCSETPRTVCSLSPETASATSAVLWSDVPSLGPYSPPPTSSSAGHGHSHGRLQSWAQGCPQARRPLSPAPAAGHSSCGRGHTNTHAWARSLPDAELEAGWGSLRAADGRNRAGQLLPSFPEGPTESPGGP